MFSAGFVSWNGLELGDIQPEWLEPTFCESLGITISGKDRSHKTFSGIDGNLLLPVPLLHIHNLYGTYMCEGVCVCVGGGGGACVWCGVVWCTYVSYKGSEWLTLCGKSILRYQG